MIQPPDIELWLCDWLRSSITDVDGLQAGNREPSDYTGDHPLIVVRDDGGGQTDRVLFDRSVGVTVKGWTRSNPYECRRLAARIYAILTDESILQCRSGGPVLAVDEPSCNGPYQFDDDNECACYYMTFRYILDGETQDR